METFSIQAKSASIWAQCIFSPNSSLWKQCPSQQSPLTFISLLYFCISVPDAGLFGTSGSKDVIHNTSIGPIGKVLFFHFAKRAGAPTFLTPSTDRAQGIICFRIMHMTKTLRWFSVAGVIFVHLKWESLNLILAQRSEVSNVNSSSLLYPQRKGDTPILKELYPTYLRQMS